MKAILMSDRPEWVVKILNGEKPIEIRKTMPKCELPIDVYIHCTKNGVVIEKDCGLGFPEPINGKVVAKFTLRKIDKLEMENPYEGRTRTFLDEACVTIGEARGYAGGEHPRYNPLYAWHISDLIIFDEPKELNQFQKVGTLAAYQKALEKACEEDEEIAERREEEIAWCGESSWLPNCAELTEAAYQMGEFGLKRPPQSWQYVEVRE